MFNDLKKFNQMNRQTNFVTQVPVSKAWDEALFTFEELDDLLRVLHEKMLVAEEHAFISFLMPDQIGSYQASLRARGYSNFQVMMWNKDLIPPYAQQNRFASTTTFMLLAFFKKGSRTAGGPSSWHFEVTDEGEDGMMQVIKLIRLLVHVYHA